MLVFDEKKYAESIINNKKYLTIKSQGKERCIIVRYLTNIGKSIDEIKDILNQIPMSGGEYLSSKEKDVIFSKIINKANQYEYVTNKEIHIYQEELDNILSLEDENMQQLLFAYLVYYKWGVQIKHLQFFSKKNNIFMVVENNNDIWKLAGVSKLRVNERYMLCNKLFNLGLYKLDNFKAHNYIYIPFAKNEGEPIITISNFENIIGELLIYKYPNEYKRCCICGVVIKKTRSPKKYCQSCAKEENIRKTKKNKERLKTQKA